MTDLSARRWSDDELEAERRGVLALWPTGLEVDLDEAVEYHRRLPSSRRYLDKVRSALDRGATLAQPRGGVALLDGHVRLLCCLQDEGGADLLPTTTDSYTRNERFGDAQRGIEESRREGRSVLNGLPVVCHGVAACRKVVESVREPVILLSGTAMPRLVAEVVLAAGYTAFLGSGIAYTISYTKTMPLEAGIRNYQYVDRLVSWYAERRVVIYREQPGFLTGTLVPPGLSVAISALDCLLAASQGVRHYGVGVAQCLCLKQDVAALRVLPEVCRSYLSRLGYDDVFLPVVSHQWMGAFPPDEPRAYGVISLGAAIAALGEATVVVTKSCHEALGVPAAESNACGVRATKQVLRQLGSARYPDSPDLKLEMAMIRDEATAIVERVLELGDGDAAVGAVRAFQAGVLDVPWSPSMHNAHRVMPARDSAGAVRYLEPGNLPLPAHVAEYHREKLADRGRLEGRPVGPDMAIDDVMSVADGWC